MKIYILIFLLLIGCKDKDLWCVKDKTIVRVRDCRSDGRYGSTTCSVEYTDGTFGIVNGKMAMAGTKVCIESQEVE